MRACEHAVRRGGFLLVLLAPCVAAEMTSASLQEQLGLGMSYPVATGVVYEDLNRDRARDPGEPGIPLVAVSNGRDVALTDGEGRYELPAFVEMVLFVTKPAGYRAPLNANHQPQFFYVHQPAGSPAAIQAYPGLAPTGPLPGSVDFPLDRHPEPAQFRAVFLGDTQVTSEEEIVYLRDSVVREVQLTQRGAQFAMALGDNVNDTLSLYPRFLAAMAQMELPIYFVPGNHDMNYDSPEDEHSLDTFKRFFGPSYYSFDVGRVHFVVLDTIVWNGQSYHGEVDPIQLEWLQNDLAMTPRDRLIALSMHIPLVSWIDRNSESGMVANRLQIYELLRGRQVIALGGHTHTLESFFPGQQEEGWGQPIPIQQIIIGAACGSWWSGTKDEEGIPLSYQRDAAPKGYFPMLFDAHHFLSSFKAIGKPVSKQMNLSFLVPNRPLGMLEGVLSEKDLLSAYAVANVWNGRKDTAVSFQIDDSPPLRGELDPFLADPYALRLQSMLDVSLVTKGSSHVWKLAMPALLPPGSHRLTVRAWDHQGLSFEETKLFEVWADNELPEPVSGATALRM